MLLGYPLVPEADGSSWHSDTFAGSSAFGEALDSMNDLSLKIQPQAGEAVAPWVSRLPIDRDDGSQRHSHCPKNLLDPMLPITKLPGYQRIDSP